MIDFITLYDSAIQPTRGSMYSVGYDLYSPCNLILCANATTKIPLGISLRASETVWGHILDRSSMGLNGLHVFGGVVDPDYTGEICVLLHNTNTFDIQIHSGDRVAQMVFHSAVIDDTTDSSNERGQGGFGSTGK